jgi:hypothetical protein
MGRIRGLGRSVLVRSNCSALSMLVMTFRRGPILPRDSRCGLRVRDRLLRLDVGVLGIAGGQRRLWSAINVLYVALSRHSHVRLRCLRRIVRPSVWGIIAS